MCGIVGYAGDRQASEVIFPSLQRLEYRGYDSSGLAVQNGSGIEVRRAGGRLDKLGHLLQRRPVHGTVGIGHTRWATHGEPNEKNAHPHMDCDARVAVVHNGIIENGANLRRELEARGHAFRSDTDSEVLAHLIEESDAASLSAAVSRALRRIEGPYGVAVMRSNEPGQIVCARRGPPLMVGILEGATLVASDAAALLPYTREILYLEDLELAEVSAEGCELVKLDDLTPVTRVPVQITWAPEDVDKGDFSTFMLKEIHDQPRAIEDTLRGRLIGEDVVRLTELDALDGRLSATKSVVIVACGTSWHAGHIGKYLIEGVARLPTQIEYASEWRYRDPVTPDETLVIGISQSGETADTAAALQLAKERGAATIGIVNVEGSRISRLVDAPLYLHAGPEIGVASTKAFTCQVVALATLALHLAQERSFASRGARTLIAALRTLPDLVERVLGCEEQVAALATRMEGHSNYLYLGRGYSYPVALEGALKLKEISYLHAEGLSAAEMKHGPIALIDRDMPVIAVAPQDNVYPKLLSNLEEVKARQGRLVAVTTRPNGLARLAEECLLVPPTVDSLLPVLTTIPLQLLAYHVGMLHGCDVDRPRNLAKSVTVE